MPFMPFNILGMWFRGLLAIAILLGGLALLRKCRASERVEPVGIQDSARADIVQRIIEAHSGELRRILSAVQCRLPTWPRSGRARPSRR